MEIVEVEWLDAQEETTALTLEGARQQEPFPVKSVGVLIEDNEEKVIVAAAHFQPEDNAGFFRATWTIPKGAVKKIKRLGKV